MLVVTIVVFFVLRMFIGTFLAIIPAVALHIGWWAFNKRAATKRLFKASISAYFSLKAAGHSIEESLEGVIYTRYPMSAAKRELFRKLFLKDKDHSSHSEEERVKKLVYYIFCFENDLLPTFEMDMKIRKSIDKVYNSISRKYLG